MLNEFYTIENFQLQENQWQGTVVFNAAHAIFKGHFPGQPVVPGVCLMQIVREQLAKALNISLFMNGAPQVKFLQLITPDTPTQLSINWEEVNEKFEVVATYFNEKPLNKMSLSLQKEK